MTHTCNKTNGGHGSHPRFSVEEIQTRPMYGAAAPHHQEIAALAYSYWEAAGRRSGRDWEDWFRAERELRVASVAYAH
ncbi:MAG: DUF2934 domain-containing protein [Bryobacteraceae bacterium]